MLALGGVFWREATPAYTSRRLADRAFTIPQWSVCDVRELSAGWSHVKVLVGDVWRVAWVQDLPRNHVGIAHHPFLTFGYYSFGTEKRPDLEWHRTVENLLGKAEQERASMTREALVSLFGAEMVDGDARPTHAIEGVPPVPSPRPLPAN